MILRLSLFHILLFLSFFPLSVDVLPLHFSSMDEAPGVSCNVFGSWHRTYRRDKAYKSQVSWRWFVVGNEIVMDNVQSLYCWALLRTLEYCRLKKDGWLDWISKNWNPLLNYTPTIGRLSNRWFVFLFLEDSCTMCNLECLYLIGKGSLVLSQWWVDFDPIQSRVSKRHLWLLL